MLLDTLQVSGTACWSDPAVMSQCRGGGGGAAKNKPRSPLQFYVHFTEVETRARRGQATCPRSHRQPGQGDFVLTHAELPRPLSTDEPRDFRSLALPLRASVCSSGRWSQNCVLALGAARRQTAGACEERPAPRPEGSVVVTLRTPGENWEPGFGPWQHRCTAR